MKTFGLVAMWVVLFGGMAVVSIHALNAPIDTDPVVGRWANGETFTVQQLVKGIRIQEHTIACLEALNEIKESRIIELQDAMFSDEEPDYYTKTSVTDADGKTHWAPMGWYVNKGEPTFEP